MTDAIDYNVPANIENFTRGTKTLIGGVPGSGKTTTLPTFLQRPDIEALFVIGTEPGFEESLLDSAARLGVDVKKLHYRYVTPTVTSFSALPMIWSKAWLGFSRELRHAG